MKLAAAIWIICAVTYIDAVLISDSERSHNEFVPDDGSISCTCKGLTQKMRLPRSNLAEVFMGIMNMEIDNFPTYSEFLRECSNCSARMTTCNLSSVTAPRCIEREITMQDSYVPDKDVEGDFTTQRSYIPHADANGEITMQDSYIPDKDVKGVFAAKHSHIPDTDPKGVFATKHSHIPDTVPKGEFTTKRSPIPVEDVDVGEFATQDSYISQEGFNGGFATQETTSDELVEGGFAMQETTSEELVKGRFAVQETTSDELVKGRLAMQETTSDELFKGGFAKQETNTSDEPLKGRFATQEPDTTNEFVKGSSGRIRRGTRGSALCNFPKNMKTAYLSCTQYPSSITCTEKCIFGFTLDEGITREMKCSYKENVWKPLGFQECSPFVDCTMTLIASGWKSCRFGTISTPSECNVTCGAYEDKPAIPLTTYTCDVFKSWTVKLPHCVISGSGFVTVPAPRIRLHSLNQEPDTRKQLKPARLNSNKPDSKKPDFRELETVSNKPDFEELTTAAIKPENQRTEKAARQNGDDATPTPLN